MIQLSTSTVKMRFEGDTDTFRAGFIRCSIPGRYEDKDGGMVDESSAESRTGLVYVRIINYPEDLR